MLDVLSEHVLGFDSSEESPNRLRLDMRKVEDRQLMTQLLKFKLPPMEFLTINRIGKFDKLVKQFLKNSFPESVQRLSVNENSGYIQIPLKSYHVSLTCCLHKVIFLFNLTRFIIPSVYLPTLISAAKNCSTIGINSSVLLTEKEVNFGHSLDCCNLQTLSFFQSGSRAFSDWGRYPERLRNLLKGIGRTKNAQNVRLYLRNCEVGAQEIREMLEEYGLTAFGMSDDEY